MWDDTFLLLLIKCTLGVFPALAFVADFPPVALKFQRRTQRQRLRNLGTTDKKIISQNQAQKDSESTLPLVSFQVPHHQKTQFLSS